MLHDPLIAVLPRSRKLKNKKIRLAELANEMLREKTDVVRAIAEERGIAMPNFFAYMLWASLVLIPLFALLTLLPISPLLKLG